MYDAIIVGGGMIGSAMSLGLAQQGRRIALIEPSLPAPFTATQPPDLRLSALSVKTTEILDQLGAWQHIEQMRFRAYDTLSVWDDGFADRVMTEFTAEMLGLDRLGVFVENRLTQLALHSELHKFTTVDWITDTKVMDINSATGDVFLDNSHTIQAKWIIGADGSQSQIRELASIGQTGWQYGQSALGIIISLEHTPKNQTWQQFRADGPVALLPMYDNYAALIWYDKRERIEQLQRLADEQLYDAIINTFPEQLSREFVIQSKAAFPLSRAHAHQYVKDRVILLGDAAHTINPLAGQGVNIGFKDVEALLNVFADHEALSVNVLEKEYERKRKAENALMMTMMDALYVTFSNDIMPLKWLRNAGLAVANNAGWLKKQALKYALGI